MRRGQVSGVGRQVSGFRFQVSDFRCRVIYMLTKIMLCSKTRTLKPGAMIYSHAMKNLRPLATSRGRTDT